MATLARLCACNFTFGQECPNYEECYLKTPEKFLPILSNTFLPRPLTLYSDDNRKVFDGRQGHPNVDRCCDRAV